MILICAWCKRVLGTKEPMLDTSPTHGICKDCADEIKKKYGMSDILTSDDIDAMEKLLDKGSG